MDEMDHIQEAASAAQEALMAERRRRADAEARTLPPAARECDDCGCDIPAERLRAKPTATRCVDCQAEAEKSWR